MKEIHVSFDLETLGNTPQAPIIQIGAEVYDDQGDVLGFFDETADIDTIKKRVFVTDYSTIKWWFDQIRRNPQLAKMYSNKECISQHQLISNFYIWLDSITKGVDPTKVYYWSHSTFDPPILQNHFQVFNKGLIPFRQFMDLRTLALVTGESFSKRVGNHHNAYDDAVFQGEYVRRAFILNRKLN